MEMYIVNYDLHSPGQDYCFIQDAIKSFGNCHHCLKSTWIVESDWSSKKIGEYLKQFIDDNDYLIVSRINSDAFWEISDEGVDKWMKKKLGPE